MWEEHFDYSFSSRFLWEMLGHWETIGTNIGGTHLWLFILFHWIKMTHNWYNLFFHVIVDEKHWNKRKHIPTYQSINQSSIFQDYYKWYIQVVVEWITMVYRCSSNPGTNIGKPVFMNDPIILFKLMFKSLFYSIDTIFQMEWNEMK